VRYVNMIGGNCCDETVFLTTGLAEKNPPWELQKAKSRSWGFNIGDHFTKITSS